jgi:hypothetical protein
MNMEHEPIIGYNPDEDTSSEERMREFDRWLQQAVDMKLTNEEIDKAIAALSAIRMRLEQDQKETVQAAEKVKDETVDR